ncbi:MAG: hypothetical protein WC748_08335 [Legionellales bacterium]
MKQTQISLRLNRSEYEQVKRYAKKNHLTINQTLRDLLDGKRCFCLHQNLLNHPSTHSSTKDTDDEKLMIAAKTFELVYESLILLRDFTAITNPELTDLATEKRLTYFEEAEES